MRATAHRELERVLGPRLRTPEDAPERELVLFGVSPRKPADVLGHRLELVAVDPCGDGPAVVAPDARDGAEDEDVAIDLRRERGVRLAADLDVGYGIPS